MIAIVRPVARAVAVAALPVVEPDEPLALPVRFAVIVPAVKLPEASRATIADAVFADAAVVAELNPLRRPPREQDCSAQGPLLEVLEVLEVLHQRW